MVYADVTTPMYYYAFAFFARRDDFHHKHAADPMSYYAFISSRAATIFAATSKSPNQCGAGCHPAADW